MDGWMDGRIGEWMDEWVDEWMDGWIIGQFWKTIAFFGPTLDLILGHLSPNMMPISTYCRVKRGYWKHLQIQFNCSLLHVMDLDPPFLKESTDFLCTGMKVHGG